jgi:hypothetical protein
VHCARLHQAKLFKAQILRMQQHLISFLDVGALACFTSCLSITISCAILYNFLFIFWLKMSMMRFYL